MSTDLHKLTTGIVRQFSENIPTKAMFDKYATAALQAILSNPSFTQALDRGAIKDDQGNVIAPTEIIAHAAIGYAMSMIVARDNLFEQCKAIKKTIKAEKSGKPIKVNKNKLPKDPSVN